MYVRFIQEENPRSCISHRTEELNHKDKSIAYAIRLTVRTIWNTVISILHQRQLKCKLRLGELV